MDTDHKSALICNAFLHAEPKERGIHCTIAHLAAAPFQQAGEKNHSHQAGHIRDGKKFSLHMHPQ
jgi:hypothetical protein